MVYTEKHLIIAALAAMATARIIAAVRSALGRRD